jgi:hypothetical protein
MTVHALQGLPVLFLAVHFFDIVQFTACPVQTTVPIPFRYRSDIVPTSFKPPHLSFLNDGVAPQPRAHLLDVRASELAQKPALQYAPASRYALTLSGPTSPESSGMDGKGRRDAGESCSVAKEA